MISLQKQKVSANKTSNNKLRKLSHSENEVTIVRETNPLYEIKNPAMFKYLDSDSYNEAVERLANSDADIKEIEQYLLGEIYS
ncbi:hypothetical protein [Rickettsia endosymbiont of Halotydeus destructor]|uniref:hypothetical protein n=1 Tax=Rickettsia endosymbiont of Halotydeus destructor TaxID=2996754 RepID=UPI003BB11990